MIQRDYWQTMQDTKDDMQRKFEATSPEVFTKNYAMRLRLRRDLAGDIPREEYGNYDKFDSNKVEMKNDPGYDDMGTDNFQGNYNKMLRQLNTKDGDAARDTEEQVLNQTVANYNVAGQTMMKKFNMAREGQDLDVLNKLWEKEKKMVQSYHDDDVKYLGRLSPFAKELIYRNYLKGATIKDLSLRYGVLP